MAEGRVLLQQVRDQAAFFEWSRGDGWHAEKLGQARDASTVGMGMGDADEDGVLSRFRPGCAAVVLDDLRRVDVHRPCAAQAVLRCGDRQVDRHRRLQAHDSHSHLSGLAQEPFSPVVPPVRIGPHQQGVQAGVHAAVAQVGVGEFLVEAGAQEFDVERTYARLVQLAQVVHGEAHGVRARVVVRQDEALAAQQGPQRGGGVAVVRGTGQGLYAGWGKRRS